MRLIFISDRVNKKGLLDNKRNKWINKSHEIVMNQTYKQRKQEMADNILKTWSQNGSKNSPS